MGTPFIIMGKKKFDCTLWVKRNRSLKKKILDEKVERDIYETTLIYIDVTLYLSQNAKAEKVLETTQYYKRCSSRKLNDICRWNWNKSNISML